MCNSTIPVNIPADFCYPGLGHASPQALPTRVRVGSGVRFGDSDLRESAANAGVLLLGCALAARVAQNRRARALPAHPRSG